MTHFPKYLKTYPNMHTAFPLHLSLNQLPHGYPAHRHDFLEFSYVVEGFGEEIINGVCHPMAPGTFTFILPYQVHEIVTQPGSTLKLYNCSFSLDLLMDSGINGTLGGLVNDWDRQSPFTQFQEQNREYMKKLLEEMYQEYAEGHRWRETMLKAQLWEILIRFDRYRQETRGDSQLPVSSTGVKSSVWPIIHYIHNHYQEELMLSNLAEAFSMSMSRISELIKQATGQTFVHFLHDLRIRHASGLLASTDLSVIEIAHEVGYGSYKTFYRMFREKKGVIPTEYRKIKR
ncbi:AraC family transcriptional regulator [Paenibacillus sp. J2TS4]|uniref:AraC family transcriptional regulator n=1 Tax=Paenibacillus sp. J2TS4 TaxID=2807194 RepID=UPI001B102F95|nr:AraC family transcriptional regulator [Paenibacillus sp. J2TS4]GIP33724.1 hypothetical protein J2TS4_29340 [Paenibacillus sp. J2TS4]